ncbi:rCG23327 [Rattus norvegicus]|uniref:RCG23327 n=1 Tax=Rattus norvegicus TaxID=10116 RepID=A6JQD8_RAT|nr:rCG23327 [Rattus norvegicus]
MLWGALRQALQLWHGEHRVTAKDREEQGAGQWEPMWWVFPGAGARGNPHPYAATCAISCAPSH